MASQKHSLMGSAKKKVKIESSGVYSHLTALRIIHLKLILIIKSSDQKLSIITHLKALRVL